MIKKKQKIHFSSFCNLEKCLVENTVNIFVFPAFFSFLCIPVVPFPSWVSQSLMIIWLWKVHGLNIFALVFPYSGCPFSEILHKQLKFLALVICNQRPQTKLIVVASAEKQQQAHACTCVIGYYATLFIGLFNNVSVWADGLKKGSDMD